MNYFHILSLQVRLYGWVTFVIMVFHGLEIFFCAPTSTRWIHWSQRWLVHLPLRAMILFLVPYPGHTGKVSGTPPPEVNSQTFSVNLDSQVQLCRCIYQNLFKTPLVYHIKSKSWGGEIGQQTSSTEVSILKWTMTLTSQSETNS